MVKLNNHGWGVMVFFLLLLAILILVFVVVGEIQEFPMV